METTAPTETEGRVRKFTDNWVANAPLPPKPPAGESWRGRVEWCDKGSDGLWLRVSWTGTKTWLVQYRLPGDNARRRVILGRYPTITLKDARLRAKAATLKAAQEQDAAAEKRAARNAPTVEWLAGEFLRRYVAPKKAASSARKDEGNLRKHVFPAWGNRRARDIRKRDVIELLEGIRDAGAPVAANRVLAVIRKMFAWAVEVDLLDASPCAGIKPLTKEAGRERYLSDDEIRALWHACDKLKPVMAAHWRLRLLTGQRGGEVLSAAWADMDLDKALWTIPAAKAKNRTSHRVPLSPTAVQLLRDLKAQLGEAAVWVCPGLKGGHLHEIGPATKQIKAISGVDFRPHDLRHTVATNLSQLGCDHLTIARILNHISVDATMTARYDHHPRDREKRKALDKWDKRLMGIVGDGSNAPTGA
jgi:integrase